MIVDLTRDYIGSIGSFSQETSEIHLRSANTAYTGMIYQFHSGSMQGTYLDLPGHIRETDDGYTAESFPTEQLYRRPASVIRLNRESGSGAVSAGDLEAAFAGKPETPVVIINALGSKNPDQIETRSVFLDMTAVQWLIDAGCRMLVSDIYESQALEGVFLKLFQAGICTVCEPVNLAKVTARTVKLTILFPKFPQLTQFPCRAVAEWDEPCRPL
ncbi:MAG: cyclase family protein [Lentisphaeria bacterium]